MSAEGRRPPGGAGFAEREEAEVARLLAEAGPRPPLPEEDLDRLADAVRRAAREELGGTAPSGGRRWWLAAAAALAIAGGLGGWWAWRGVSPPPAVAHVEAVHGELTIAEEAEADGTLAVGDAIARGAQVCTGGGADGGAALRLARGGELRLAAESCVRLAAASEVALLRGALFADTGATAGGEPALVVGTAFGEVRDVGTRFAVRLLADAVEVRVREGAVTVAGAHRAEAGEQVVLHRDGRVERRSSAPFGPGWEWVIGAGGDFPIDGRTVAEVLDWVARETGWVVRYADAEVAADAAEIVLHGEVPGLAPDEAPAVVLPGAGLTGEVTDGVLVVERSSPR